MSIFGGGVKKKVLNTMKIIVKYPITLRHSSLKRGILKKEQCTEITGTASVKTG